MKQILAVFVLFSALFVISFDALSADYPSKSITIVCPYSPGGGSDVMTRVIAQVIKENKLVPEPVMVVNKTGGGGLVGKTYVFKKPADGYYITLADLGNVISPIVSPSTQWKINDWAYIANMVYDFNLLCVKADTYKDLSSLVQAAKKDQATFSAGGTGAAGGPDSLCTLKLNQAAGLKISYLPQKGGGDVVASLLGGHITMGWFNPSEILPQIEAGKAVPLAVTAKKRLAVLPNVPTFQELGYNLVYVQQRGLAMKGGVSADIIRYWIDILNKVRSSKEWQEGYLKKNSLEDGWMPGDEFKKWMDDEVEDFKSSLKALKEMGG